MNKLNMVAGMAVGVTMALLPGTAIAQAPPELNLGNADNGIHILPTVSKATPVGQAGGVLLYHAGGSVMTGAISTYAIFWVPVPAKLQNGGATSMSAHYQAVQKAMLADYPGHGIDNNNTQYYQTIGGLTTYIQNSGHFAGFHVDTNPYPASGCTDTATPGNCITDAQIQTEIENVMTAVGWKGGLNKMFLLYTSSGEGSCFDPSSTVCAYTYYCAYHGHFSIGTTPVIYGNEPYGDLTNCQIAGTPSPNGDPLADAVASTASHELTEAITDPLLNAWYTSSGAEIGDLCSYLYGTNSWDGSPAKANQMWNGHFYELQTQYDNHLAGCVQVGP
jgi:hypothetical protein